MKRKDEKKRILAIVHGINSASRSEPSSSSSYINDPGRKRDQLNVYAKINVYWNAIRALAAYENNSAARRAQYRSGKTLEETSAAFSGDA